MYVPWGYGPWGRQTRRLFVLLRSFGLVLRLGRFEPLQAFHALMELFDRFQKNGHHL